MREQALLFDVGRAKLPHRVTVYASGANEAREIRGFALAGIPVGVAASHLREGAITELIRSRHPVFVDSSAFSEISFADGSPIVTAPTSDEEWVRRLGIYLRLSLALSDKLSVVAPDQVASQAVTLERLEQYAGQLREIAQSGAQVLLPVQTGVLCPSAFLDKARSVTGLDLMRLFP